MVTVNEKRPLGISGEHRRHATAAAAAAAAVEEEEMADLVHVTDT